MGEEYNREEFGNLIKNAYDRNTPDDYTKKMIFNRIEDEHETNEGRRTVMENMFRVRYICLTGIMLILLVLLPGGTYTAVKMINDGEGLEENKPENNNDHSQDKINKPENSDDEHKPVEDKPTDGYAAETPEEYKAVALRILSGDYDDAVVETSYYGEGNVGIDAYDRRLSEALEQCDMPGQIYYSDDNMEKYVFIGVLGGRGISDRVFYKDEYRIYAVYAYEYIGDPDNEYMLMDNDEKACTGYVEPYLSEKDRKEGKTGVSTYPYGELYRFKVGKTAYYINDITDFCCNHMLNDVIELGFTETLYGNMIYDGKSGVVRYEENITPTEPIDVRYHVDEVYNDISVNEQKKEYHNEADKEDWDDMLGRTFTVNSDNYLTEHINDPDAIDKFKKEFPDEITTENYRYKLESGFCYPDVLNAITEDNTGAKNAGNGRVCLRLKGLHIEDLTDNSVNKTITIKVENAYICRKKKVSEEEEKDYEKIGYLGSMVNSFTDRRSKDRYTVYLNCGNSLTIPFDEQDTLDSYGIYIDSSWIDLHKDFISDSLWGLNWYDYYLSNCADISVRVSMDYGFEDQGVVIRKYPYENKITFQDTTMKTVYGWMQ